MAAARVLLLRSGRSESPSFAQSVCGLLGAGPGLGPWPTHCGWKRGRLVLSDRPFPGASARLPLQVGSRGARGAGAGVMSRRRRLGSGGSWRERPGGARIAPTRPPPLRAASPDFEAFTQTAPSHQRPPFCPFVALDQQLRAPGAELPRNRGVDLGVAVLLQSSDQSVLLTRRTRTLSVSPNLWVPPGECPEDKIPSPGEGSGPPPNSVIPSFRRTEKQAQKGGRSPFHEGSQQHLCPQEGWGWGGGE